jgi:hypothetical protein
MTGTKILRIPYGEREGNLLHISDVERGLKCSCACPVCKTQLVARKGNKTAHHFAHYVSATCNAETLLHHLGKRLLHERISVALSNNQPLPIKWECVQCGDFHEVNMVKSATGVRIEQNLGPCRPDITLVKANGSPSVFVEVVVKHAPDETVVDYVRQHNIALVEFHIKSVDDLERISQSEVLLPLKVNVCSRPKCKICGRPLRKRVLHVVDASCWKSQCGRPMKIAIGEIEGLILGPEDFTDQELAVARQHGAILKNKYNQTAQKSYLSNTCSHCGAFVGLSYLLDYCYLMTRENACKANFGCVYCDILRVTNTD